MHDRRDIATVKQTISFATVNFIIGIEPLHRISYLTVRTDPAGGTHSDQEVYAYSLTRLLRWAAWSFLMSSGESFGRSMVKVTLSSLPVKLNGGW